MRRSLVSSCALAALFLVPATAAAQPYDGTAEHPVRYLLDGVTPTVVVTPAPPPVVVTRPVTPMWVEVEQPYSDPVVVTVHDHERDPYDTAGIVIVGAGVGGLVFPSSAAPGATLAYRLTLGLAVGPADFSLRFDLAPGLGQTDAGRSWGFYTFGASFGYRFLDDAVVHPVAGFGLEGVSAGENDGALAFAMTARGGLELAYPMSDGALALGIDVTGHHAFGTRDFPAAYSNAVSFGAYANWRF